MGAPWYVHVFMSSTKRRQSKNCRSHLMHLQVDVRLPHLGIQGIMRISSVVFQTATLLQVGLELLFAPPEGKEREREKKKGWRTSGINFSRALITVSWITVNHVQSASFQSNQVTLALSFLTVHDKVKASQVHQKQCNKLVMYLTLT